MVKNFKETWRIINIDDEPNNEAFLNFKLDSDLSKSYEWMCEEIKKLNVKFDSIICLVNDEVPSEKISEKEIFDEVDKLLHQNLMVQLLGNKEFLQSMSLYVQKQEKKKYLPLVFNYF